MRNNVNFLHVCFIRYSIIQESWNPLTPFWKSKDILVWNWSLQTSEYYISIKGLVVVLAWYLLCSAKMMMPHIFYIYRYTEMFYQYLQRIIFFLYCWSVEYLTWQSRRWWFRLRWRRGTCWGPPRWSRASWTGAPWWRGWRSRRPAPAPAHTAAGGTGGHRTLTRTNTSPTLVLSSKP